MKGLNCKDIIKGQKYRIIADYGSHKLPIGTIVTAKDSLAEKNRCDDYPSDNFKIEESTMWIKAREVEFAVVTLEHLEKERDALEVIADKADEAVTATETRIEYMKDNDVKSFCEYQFKAWGILQMIDNKSISQIEKAKLIAKLVKA